MHSIIDYERYYPSFNSNFFGVGDLPRIMYYSSSTEVYSGDNVAWGIEFIEGKYSLGYKDQGKYNFRAVRGGQSDDSDCPKLSVSPVNQNVSQKEGSTGFIVTNTGAGNMEWSASVTSDSDWLRIIYGSGSNLGTIECDFDANNTISERTATIRITATGATGSPIDVTITQAVGTPLIVDQTPISGSPGTTFVMSGKGFTPNSTATLHFRKPDGTELPTCTQPINAVGKFSGAACTLPSDTDGVYTWWAVDGVKGWKSNERPYTINSTQNISTGNYKVTNSRTISNEFELWLDIAINNEAPGTDFWNKYKIEIKDATMPSGVSIKTNEGNYYCEHKGNGSLNGGKSSRYRQFFQIVGLDSSGKPLVGSYPAYFENGKVVIISKTTGNVVLEIKDLTKFRVYGTNFDIKQHAWSFANRSWHNIIPLTDISEAANSISRYISSSKKGDFWEEIGSGWSGLFVGSLGLCYGMSNTAIANFNHQHIDRAWGIDEEIYLLSDWDSQILKHWSKDNDYAMAPPKPPAILNLDKPVNC